MTRKGLSFLAAAIIVGATLFAAPKGHAEDFYKGKTFRFIVGFSPGGGYDTYTRLIARYFGKYVPGNPTTLVQNMTGAGSLISANYIGRRAKPDGLSGAVFNNSLIVQSALGDKKAGAVPFDKMEWVGAPSRGEIVCMMMAFTGKTTWKDVINSKEPIKIGATRAGSTGHDIPAILNKAMGTKLKIITGYRGTATIRLALEGREVDGFCSQWESMRVTARGMLDAEGDQKLVPFVIDSHSYPDPEIQKIPLFKDVLNEEGLKLYNSWAFQMAFQRMLALPPGTPKDRLEILRKAYAKTLKDPQMLAEAKKAKLVVTPVSGPEVKRLVDGILNMPPEVRESLSFLVGQTKK
ncbi:MAG: hypothetical protein OXF11_12415 [Deltaproteobacteria bacterium]|nr:hypothetical protein [Deltaproteobacteria bacterium]